MTQIIASIIMGIGLSACCGIRAILPLLGISVASRLGYIHLNPNFLFLSSNAALIVFSLAAILEILAYKVPLVDNFMDAISVPTAIIAGGIAEASFIKGIDPLLALVIGLIVGGSISGLVKVASGTLRAGVTVATAGVGNIFLSIKEDIISVVSIILSIFLPYLALLLLLLIGIVIFIIIKIIKKRKSK